MNNGITAENLMRVLPAVFHSDDKVMALADASAAEFAELVQGADSVRLYSRLSELPEELLDVLAHDFKVDWYNYDLPVEVKRQLISDSKAVHRLLGTKWAVERVISEYFGEGRVMEWFEYGGEPHHFKVISSNPQVTNERLSEFLRLLNIVKRQSSWLEDILIVLTATLYLYTGAAYHDTTHEIHTMGSIDDLQEVIA